MNATQSAFFRRLHAKAATLTPAMAKAYLAGLAALRERLSTKELNALIAAGDVAGYISLALNDANFNAAFAKYRGQIQLTMRDAAKYVAKDIPGVKAAGVMFDYLSPDVIAALRKLDTQVMTRLATDTREMVRAYLENGLTEGVSTRETARYLRDLIGLGPTQWSEVENYRAALEAGKAGKALGYAARDRRFDASVKNGALDAAKIDKMVEAYTKRRIALNAATTAHTATMDAFKEGQRLSWQDAIDRGFIDGGMLQKEWVGVGDERERETHLMMNGTTIPFDEPYILPDGQVQMVPGESEFNCRCVSRYFVGRGDSTP